MKPKIDIEDSLQDSPAFRHSLNKTETDLEKFETTLTQVLQNSEVMITKGKKFIEANNTFLKSLNELGDYFIEDTDVKEFSYSNDDLLISKLISKSSVCLQEISQFQNTLLEKTQISIGNNITKLIEYDLQALKDYKKNFQKTSTDFDSALYRSSNISKLKKNESYDVAQNLKENKNIFTVATFNYIREINEIIGKKRSEIAIILKSILCAQQSFFRQGHEYFKNESNNLILELSDNIAVIERNNIDDRIRTKSLGNKFLSADAILESFPVQLKSKKNETNDSEYMAGYLWRKTNNKLKPWVRRWFSISCNVMKYCKRDVFEWTVLENDLLICKVRKCEDTERLNCFELMSPKKIHVLQADSHYDYNKWVNFLNVCISNAMNDQLSDKNETNLVPVKPQGDLHDFLSLLEIPNNTDIDSRIIMTFPGNNKCCDCMRDSPDWTSINLGITLCIQCCGIHRSLGVHTSKVRSITLDKWDNTLLRVMARLGNDAINKIYEANVSENIKRANLNSTSFERESWIKAKYIAKEFVIKLPTTDEARQSGKKRWMVQRFRNDTEDFETKSNSSLLMIGSDFFQSLTSFNDPFPDDNSSEIDFDESCIEGEDFDSFNSNVILFKAALARQPLVVLEALALGADINYKFEKKDGQTALMAAVEIGSQVTTELLLLNNASIDLKDSRGRTALHHCILNERKSIASQLIKRKANFRSVDENGKDPLQIALDMECADLVALLRIAQLHDELAGEDDNADMLNQAISDLSTNDID